ncbi:MAG: sensor histidine kinase [Candidatus Rifleibacteriota bacterium]
MNKSSTSFLEKFVPASIFSRIFLAVFLICLLILGSAWGWFYHQFFVSLNSEAESRLERLAKTIAEDLGRIENYEIDSKINLIESFWKYEKSAGWIQNLYWLDVTREKPLFIASFTSETPQRASLKPPTADQAEDMVFSYINELEEGEVVMPDPFSEDAARRFKIVIYPLLDQLKMLDSVVVIEADMKYLKLQEQMRVYLARLLLVSLFLSLVISLILAGNLAKKFKFLLGELDKVENFEIPQKKELHIDEFNRLHECLIKLAAELKTKDAHLRRVFTRKLDELDFTGGTIAHEIRNPLSAIEVHFSLLKQQMGAEISKFENPIREISEQLAHLRTLIETFLNYSRKVEPVKEKIRLRSFVEQVAKSKQQIYNNLECNFAIREDFWITFDKTMLQQVYDNIIENAALSGADRKIKIVFSAEKTNSSWLLTIENDGPPIVEELVTRLFTPFVTSRKGGNGIGLALVRKLVEANNGEIYCKNESNKVVFYIEVLFA